MAWCVCVCVWTGGGSPYSSEMSMFICSLSVALDPVRWSLVMSSMRCSLLSRKSPLAADAEPCGQNWEKEKSQLPVIDKNIYYHSPAIV